MRLGRLVIFIPLSLSVFGTSVRADTCGFVEETRPPFYVVASNGPLNRTASTASYPKSVYFPKGTIVKLDPSSLVRIPMTTRTIPFSFMPKVKVLSVPDDVTSLNLSPDRQRAQIVHNDNGLGQRVTVGMEANINGSDLNPSITTLNPTPDVNSPANVIFEVRQDTPAAIAPEYRGRAIRLQYDQASGKFAIKRCCPTPAIAQIGLNKGVNFPYEYDRNPQCNYAPVYEVLNPVDHGARTPITYTVEKRVALSDCDPAMAALSPVEQQNQRAVFMLGHTLSQPDPRSLERLQRIAWQQSLRSRKRSGDCGGGTVSGNMPKCMCKQGVNDILLAAGVITSRIPGSDAYMAATNLPPMGFENVLDRVHTSHDAPVGSILVYKNTRGGSGHIEIKVDSKTFCSDFCKEAPIDSYVPTRQLIGIFVKRK